MKLYRIIVIFIAVVFLFGCAVSSKKMNQLNLGMTKQEVIETIGEPTSTSAKRNTEYLNYHLTTGGVTPVYTTSSCWMERWRLTVSRVTSI